MVNKQQLKAKCYLTARAIPDLIGIPSRHMLVMAWQLFGR